MNKIYFDESGQTGTNLFDKEQPFFSLGSTCVDEKEAKEIIQRCFPQQQGDELKSNRLIKRTKGQKGYIKLAREIADRTDDFCASKISKRFTIVAKMVDYFVEPIAHHSGYDFYANNYAVKYANSVGFVFENILEKKLANDLMQEYNTFSRFPSKASLLKLQQMLEASLPSAPYGSEAFLKAFVDGTKEFERFHDLSNWRDSNEIHVTSAVSCMGHWQERMAGPFHVIHDESLHFFKHSEQWITMSNPDNTPTDITIAGKTLRLPIGVEKTTSEKSHMSASLQLCDLIAGLISRCNADPAPELKDFLEEAIAEGFGEISVFPVDFGTEFASGPPARLSGPDAVDKIVMAVRNQKNKTEKL